MMNRHQTPSEKVSKVAVPKKFALLLFLFLAVILEHIRFPAFEIRPLFATTETTDKKSNEQTIWAFNNSGSLLSADPRPNLPQGHDFVLIFLDSSYLDPFSVWLHYYKQHDNSQRILFVFALSEECYQQLHRVLFHNQQNILEQAGQNIVLTNLDFGKRISQSRIWSTRIQILKQLVHIFPNNNIILSDADAIWIRDPRVLYEQQASDSDIVASRATFPAKCALTARRVTMCMGFTFFRNGPLMRDFWSPMKGSDDQVAVNCRLRQQYTSIDTGNTSEGADWESFQANGTSVFKVTILPYTQIIRHCGGLPDGLYVAHCLVDKTGRNKMIGFRTTKLLTSNVTLYSWSTNQDLLNTSKRT